MLERLLHSSRHRRSHACVVDRRPHRAVRHVAGRQRVRGAKCVPPGPDAGPFRRLRSGAGSNALRGAAGPRRRVRGQVGGAAQDPARQGDSAEEGREHGTQSGRADAATRPSRLLRSDGARGGLARRAPEDVRRGGSSSTSPRSADSARRASSTTAMTLELLRRTSTGLDALSARFHHQSSAPSSSRAPARSARRACAIAAGFSACFCATCIVRGLVAKDLSKCVEMSRAYRLSGVPRSISWDDIRRMLDTVDRRTAAGRRDYAILVLLVTYGLRAREVAALTLDDIDWKRERLRVPERKAAGTVPAIRCRRPSALRCSTICSTDVQR